MHTFEIWAIFCKTSFLEFNKRDAEYYILKKSLLNFSSAIFFKTVIRILTEDNYIYFMIGLIRQIVYEFLKSDVINLLKVVFSHS